MSGYRTIVADPPWDQKAGPGFCNREYDAGEGRVVSVRRGHGASRELPYETQSLGWIRGLGIGDVAAPDAHLFVWVTNRYIRHVYEVAEAWGFSPVALLTWCKNPMGSGLGGPAFGQTTEHVLYASRGTPEVLERSPTTWWAWKRQYDSAGKPMHSAKPDGFNDIVEQVCPGPYLEVFARRARFGWDYAGDGSLGTVDIPGLRSPDEVPA